MQHYSLEVAHIYGDETFSDEHRRGLEYARWFIDSVGVENVTVSVMVDDVHAENKLDLQKLVDFINLEGVMVDRLYLESQFLEIANQWHGSEVQTFNKGKRIQRGFTSKTTGHWVAIRESLASNITRTQPTCASLVAAFMAVRLGLGFYVDPHMVFSHEYRPRWANRAVNILPQRFMRTEEKSLEIMRHVGMPEPNINKIDHIFFGNQK